MITSPFVSIGQSATFEFNPELNIACLETQERNITTKYSATGEATLISTEHESTITERKFLKNYDDFFLVEKIKKITGIMDGKKFENPINPVLLSVVQTNVISKSGHLLYVLGDEQMAIQAKKIFPPESYAQIDAQLNTNILEQVARSRWDGSVAVFVGNSVKQGDVWKNKPSADDTSLSFEYVFPSIVQTQSNTIVTVLIFGGSNSNLPSQYELENAKDLSSKEVKNFLDFIVVSEPLLKICVRRVIDANTMSVISEDEIQQTVSPASGGVQIEEERDSTTYKRKPPEIPGGQ